MGHERGFDDRDDDDFAVSVATMLLVATANKELCMSTTTAGSALDLSHAFG